MMRRTPVGLLTLVLVAVMSIAGGGCSEEPDSNSATTKPQASSATAATPPAPAPAPPAPAPTAQAEGPDVLFPRLAEQIKAVTRALKETRGKSQVSTDAVLAELKLEIPMWRTLRDIKQMIAAHPDWVETSKQWYEKTCAKPHAEFLAAAKGGPKDKALQDAFMRMASDRRYAELEEAMRQLDVPTILRWVGSGAGGVMPQRVSKK